MKTWIRDFTVMAGMLAAISVGAESSSAYDVMDVQHGGTVQGTVRLDGDVPEVVKGVYDPAGGGTGNWVFNTAYAGSFRWMRAYTTRLSDVTELEGFTAHGIPVGLSVCYNRLR